MNPTINVPTGELCANQAHILQGLCPNAISSQWSVVSAPVGGTATFAAPNSLNTLVTVNVPGAYVFQLECRTAA